MSLPVVLPTDTLPLVAVRAVALSFTDAFALVSPDRTATPTATALPSPAPAVAERDTFVSALAAILMPLPSVSAPLAVRLPSTTTSAVFVTRATVTVATTLELLTGWPLLSVAFAVLGTAMDCSISTLELAAMSILLPSMALFSPMLTDDLFFLTE